MNPSAKTCDVTGLDVHLVHLDRIEAARFEAYRALLDEGETARLDRLQVENARREFAAGRALVRTVLSRHRPDIRGEEWRFRPNAYGRPAIDWSAMGLGGRNLFFNLSHTRNLAALVVGESEPIGIDVEWIGRRRPDRDVARRYFMAHEADWIAGGASEDERTERFFALWTLKEAYIKARGMGLALPLDGFVFDCGRVPPTIAFTGKIDDDRAIWACERRIVGDDHRLALVRPAGIGAVNYFRADPLGAPPIPIDPAPGEAFA